MNPTIPGLREATDDDADGLVALIGSVFAEYPGCVLDLVDLDADLLAPRSSFGAAGARLWVVAREGEIVACAGVGEAEPGPNAPSLPGRVAELKRLYVRADQRGRGLGSTLIDLVHRAAADRGAEAIELWSDTRFHDAHRRYAAAGYEQRPVTRDLHDPSDTTEYVLWRPLAPTPPTRSVTWVGPDQLDRCHLVDGERAHRLHGTVLDRDGRWDYDVLVDDRWCTRRVTVAVDGTAELLLTADGRGRWWRDGTEVADLRGALDVDLGPTCATNTLPVRRAPHGHDGTVAHWDGQALRAVRQRYEPAGDGAWHYRSPSWEDTIQVDDDGLVLRYGDLFHR